MGEKGTTLISRALRTNDTLLSLNLSGNRVGADGAAQLADALRVNKVRGRGGLLLGLAAGREGLNDKRRMTNGQ